MLQDRIQQVNAKIAQLIALYEARHPGQKVPKIEVRFDLRGRAAGQAGRRGWNYFMRFNRDMMLNAGWDHLINDTVPHELAHVICFANGSDQGHGLFWRRTCRALGGSGERCHSEEVTYAKGRTYVYTTSTGQTFNISEVKHRRIQQGAGYTFRDRKMGRIDRTCAYSLLGAQPVITAYDAPVARVPEHVENKRETPTVSSNKPSNAELVRARIAQAKARSEMPAVVVQWAVDLLGMKVALAKTYVKNNWPKV
jgi:SprT protein